MRVCIVAVLLGTFIAPQLGCGGGGALSQDDLKRMAIQRPPDDEDDEPAASTPAISNVAAVHPTGILSEQGTDEDTSLEAQVTYELPPDSLPGPSAPTADGEPSGNDPQTQLDAEDVAPRAKPNDEHERREYSLENLDHIGRALQRYIEEHRVFPAQAVHTESGEPLLSWRVILLPYLGYDRLFKEFRLDQPWNSRHNQALLQRIPTVYQSPERWDVKTNYLFPMGSSTLCQGKRGVLASQVEDGIRNTIAVLEVDDVLAVPWTMPRDYDITKYAIRRGLGGLRDGRILGLWGDGTAAEIAGDASSSQLLAAYTYDGGERFMSGQILFQDESELAADLMTGEALAAAAAAQAAADVVEATRFESSPQGLAQELPAGRQKVPDSDDRREAMRIVKDLYQDRFRDAKTAAARGNVAAEMLEAAPSVEGDPAGHFVVLETAKQVAILSGTVDVARRATDMINQSFEVDSVELRTEAIKKLGGTIRNAQAKELVEWAAEVGNFALLAKQYDAAEQLGTLAMAQVRKVRDKKLRTTALRLRETAEFDSSLYEAAQRALANLDSNPDDASARTAIGKFTCFVEQNWQLGLPILEQCDHRQLSEIAALELRVSEDGEAQLVLADQWWTLAERQSRAAERTMQTRAVYWYRQAVGKLPAGLAKVRIQHRLEDWEQPDQPSGQDSPD